MAQAIKVSDDLYSIAKARAKAEHRSIPAQIEYWAKIGRISHDNPDLPTSFIEGILISKAEYEAGQYTEFKLD
ncbi:MAG: ParD-like family protein [Candidatus Margulisiibacteriota bacterium]